EVRRRISATLNQEFPPTQIPIVPGSAIWARKALSADAAAGGTLERPAEGVDEEAVPFEWPREAEIFESVAADKIFHASVLAALAVAISEMMQRGPAAGAIGTAASLLDAVGRNLISWLETGIEVLGEIEAGKNSGRSGLSNLVILREALVVEFGA